MVIILLARLQKSLRQAPFANMMTLKKVRKKNWPNQIFRSIVGLPLPLKYGITRQLERLELALNAHNWSDCKYC